MPATVEWGHDLRVVRRASVADQFSALLQIVLVVRFRRVEGAGGSNLCDHGVAETPAFRQFLLRGLDSMRGEWQLVCLTHNLLKVHRRGALFAG